MSELPPIVLIAEDNPCLARVLSFKFKSCGFTTIVCEDGQVAWDAGAQLSRVRRILEEDLLRDLLRRVASEGPAQSQ